MKRTFIAVKIEAGDKLKGMISDIRKRLSNDSIKWVDVNNMHITIAFLGDTNDESVDLVSEMLQKKCSGNGSFTFTISGLGIFKNINDPRVIWAGIENSEKLVVLNNIVKKGLEEIGIKTEDRAFSPHLTIGRIRLLKEKKTLENLLAKYKSASYQEVHISEVILFESILSQTGPIYKSIFSIGL